MILATARTSCGCTTLRFLCRALKCGSGNCMPRVYFQGSASGYERIQISQLGE